MSVEILQGDCRDLLPTLPAASVQCVVTSPPYWGLRDYGVEGQLGLEPTPEEYVGSMVGVFREVRRVLRDDGTVWLNMGDSYATQRNDHDWLKSGATAKKGWHGGPDLKSKDLVGMPWRLAFALQADGWYLRADIVWAKPNPMPESVTDRPTKAHEYVFLLTKSARYFYDTDAVREPATYAGKVVTLGEKSLSRGQATGMGVRPSGNGTAASVIVADGRNLRSVWTIPSAPFPDAHFATFPPALAQRCILAGSRVGDTVLDPFGGSGTVGMVAEQVGRHSILIELSPIYAAMARQRTAQGGLFAQANAEARS